MCGELNVKLPQGALAFSVLIYECESYVLTLKQLTVSFDNTSDDKFRLQVHNEFLSLFTCTTSHLLFLSLLVVIVNFHLNLMKYRCHIPIMEPHISLFLLIKVSYVFSNINFSYGCRFVIMSNEQLVPLNYVPC